MAELKDGFVLSGRYKIISQTGVGGMGVVYKAQDLQKDRIVALKVLKDEFADKEEFVYRFRREAKAAINLKHPNIAMLYDVGSDNGIDYLVMEYVDNGTLADVLKKEGTLSVERTVKYALKILAALDHAHKHNIIHRDIKPQNIMLDKDDNIKVVDFGIARIVGSNSTIMRDEVFGSVYYMSPEQSYDGKVDATSDLYSLGVMLYQMLTGQVPFTADTDVKVSLKHMNEMPKGLRAIKKDIPKSIEEVVLKALEKQSILRYPSAVAMAKDLKLALRFPKGGFVNRSSLYVRIVTFFGKNGLNAILVLLAVITLLSIVVYGVVKVSDIMYGVDVPKVVGLSYEEAISSISEADMNADPVYVYNRLIAEGQVIGQTPEAGTRSRRNRAVTLTVSMGAEPVFLPDTVGMDKASALTLLSEYGFPAVTIEYAHVPDEEMDVVLEQTPNDGSAKPGAAIKLTLNSEEIQVPALSGKTRQQAIDLLESLGLTCEVSAGYSTDDLPDTVLLQSPPAGTRVLKGSGVSITVTLASPVKYMASFNWRVPLNINVRIDLIKPSGNQVEVFSDDCELDRIIAMELESDEPGLHSLVVYYDGKLAFTEELDFI